MEDMELEDSLLWSSSSNVIFVNQFRKGKVIDYNGGRKEDDIVAFVLKRTGPPSVRLACEELKARAEKSKFAVAFFGDVNSRDYSEIYLPLATDTQV